MVRSVLAENLLGIQHRNLWLQKKTNTADISNFQRKFWDSKYSNMLFQLFEKFTLNFGWTVWVTVRMLIIQLHFFFSRRETAFWLASFLHHFLFYKRIRGEQKYSEYLIWIFSNVRNSHLFTENNLYPIVCLRSTNVGLLWHAQWIWLKRR